MSIKYAIENTQAQPTPSWHCVDLLAGLKIDIPFLGIQMSFLEWLPSCYRNMETRSPHEDGFSGKPSRRPAWEALQRQALRMVDSQEARPLLLSRAALSRSNCPASCRNGSRLRDNGIAELDLTSSFPPGDGADFPVVRVESLVPHNLSRCELHLGSLPYLPLLAVGLLERHQEGEGISRYIHGFFSPFLGQGPATPSCSCS